MFEHCTRYTRQWFTKHLKVVNKVNAVRSWPQYHAPNKVTIVGVCQFTSDFDAKGTGMLFDLGDLVDAFTIFPSKVVMICYIYLCSKMFAKKTKLQQCTSYISYRCTLGSRV